MLGYKYRANHENLKIIGLDTRIKRDANLLINNKIYTSTYDILNDPFEFYVLGEIAKLRLYLERVKGNNALDVNDKLLDLFEFSKKIGIYSLALPEHNQKYPTNELLWAHYANEHKGFCIEYDINELMGYYISSNTVNKVGVIYQSNPPTSQDLNDALKDKKNVKQTEKILQILYGVKSLSWEYENELRLIFDTSGKKSYNPSALKSIYFGLNMNLKEKIYIQKRLKNVDVKFYQMEKIENSYTLTATLISPDIDLIVKKPIYEILKTAHNPIVQNFHVLYESSNLDIVVLQDFVSKFRIENATKDCNISLYDDKVIENLIGKYPLYGEEKELMAKHLIAYSSFDAPNFIWMYPDKE